MREATSEETPYGSSITSDGWFVLNLADALAVQNDEGGAAYPLEPCEQPEPIRYPVSDVAARYGASTMKETDKPDEAYADWPGEYKPVRLAWPVDAAPNP